VIDLPIRVGTYTYRAESGEGFKTIVAAETGREQDVTFGYVIVNRSGVIAASGGDIAARGRYVTTTTLPAGGYMLKAAVIDSAGRRGSVERHFDVRLGKTANGTFGDLMIAEPGPGSAAVTAMHPVVAVVRSTELIVYTELYGGAEWTPPADAIQMELVASREGADTTSRLTPSLQRLAPGRWGITARASIDAAHQGTRFVRATIAAPGGDPVRLTRVFTLDSAR
jgi:hypothetical protein